MSYGKRKHVKYGIVLLVLLCMVAGLAACGGPAPAPPADDDNGEEPVAPLRVAYLDLGLTTVGAYNIGHFNGFVNMCDKYGFEYTYVEEVEYAEAPELVAGLVAAGYEMIISNSGGFATPFLEMAEEFPDTWFIVTSDAATTNDLPNYAAFSPHFSEMGYLAGAAAALYTSERNQKIGIIGGQPIRAINRNFYYWIEAAEAIDPDIDIQIRYTQSWVDNALAKEATLSLIADGADVIFPLLTTAEVGAIEAVVESWDQYGAVFVGYYSDLYDRAPEQNLTSQVVDMASIYDYLGDLYVSGNLEAKVYQLGLAEGIISLAPFRGKLTAEQEAIMEQIEQDILSGVIQIDPNNVYTP